MEWLFFLLVPLLGILFVGGGKHRPHVYPLQKGIGTHMPKLASMAGVRQFFQELLKSNVAEVSALKFDFKLVLEAVGGDLNAAITQFIGDVRKEPLLGEWHKIADFNKSMRDWDKWVRRLRLERENPLSAPVLAPHEVPFVGDANYRSPKGYQTRIMRRVDGGLILGLSPDRKDIEIGRLTDHYGCDPLRTQDRWLVLWGARVAQLEPLSRKIARKALILVAANRKGLLVRERIKEAEESQPFTLTEGRHKKKEEDADED